MKKVINNFEVEITQDSMGTHLDWKHDGVTAKMIDWFWSNLEKGVILWHPAQHESIAWAVPPKHGNPVGSIHVAPQTWNDGTRQNLYIRMEDLSEVTPEIKEYIIYDHAIIVAGLGFGPESIEKNTPMGYRIHQWQKTDYGVVGKSSGIGTNKIETPEEGLIWAEHCAEEISNWGVFLPQIYNLYKPVINTNANPYADLTVEGKGKDLKYKYIK